MIKQVTPSEGFQELYSNGLTLKINSTCQQYLIYLFEILLNKLLNNQVQYGYKDAHFSQRVEALNDAALVIKLLNKDFLRQSFTL